ncbi:hypothetical protein [Nocardia sp. NPDC057030]|uniref:hypothetical protein n=1 Tax=unclassified Nocardia TaxID=2637762 RepID=UPI00363BD6DF
MGAPLDPVSGIMRAEWDTAEISIESAPGDVPFDAIPCAKRDTAAPNIEWTLRQVPAEASAHNERDMEEPDVEQTFPLGLLGAPSRRALLRQAGGGAPLCPVSGITRVEWDTAEISIESAMGDIPFDAIFCAKRDTAAPNIEWTLRQVPVDASAHNWRDVVEPDAEQACLLGLLDAPAHRALLRQSGESRCAGPRVGHHAHRAGHG